MVELGKELLEKVRAWREADPSAEHFDVSEDAEEVVRYLEAAKFQLETEFAMQLGHRKGSGGPQENFGGERGICAGPR